MTTSPDSSDPLVCVVDDDVVLGRSLTRLLRCADRQVEAYTSARAYLSRSHHAGPSCLVLDIHMPEISGLELLRTLAGRDVQVVFLTGHGDVPMCADAMKAGAVDFLTKPAHEDRLLSAVSAALTRSGELQRKRYDRIGARRLLAALTPREFQVMQGVVAGLLNKQIADDLGAAIKTIKIHRARVMDKMRVTSVAALVRVAQLAGASSVTEHPERPDCGN